jgi:hypothetical protein
MKAEIADFLENRLLEGGEVAVEVETKLPELIAGRRVEVIRP